MTTMVRVPAGTAILRALAPQGDPLRLRDGGTAQGFRPLADDDDRYFERVTRIDGRVTWYELVDEVDEEDA